MDSQENSYEQKHDENEQNIQSDNELNFDNNASPVNITTNSGSEIFYAGELNRLSFSLDNDQTINENRNEVVGENCLLDEKELEKAINLDENKINEEINEENLNQDENNALNLDWKNQDKHIFILSEAGKPIYTLHGNEVNLVTLMGIMQALVSIIECDKNNRLKYIIAGDHKFVFLHRDHLIFVNISKEKNKCIEQLILELNYIYSQIISVVTLSLINKIFKTHHNYDLRNKLSGTEKLLTNIINRCKSDYGMLLNCVSCYPLAYELREQIGKLLIQNINQLPFVLFALLFIDNRLIAIIRPKKKQLHPIDIHLLLNVITGLDTPKMYAEFTCYPICLPNFDNSAVMYANISYLDENFRVCLILLTGLCDHEQSLKLNDCRKRIQDKFISNYSNIFNLKTPNQIDDDINALKNINISELKHFLYKDRKLFQYFATEYSLPYSISNEQRQRLFDIYQSLYHKLHNQTYSLRIIYYRQNYETVLGWLTSEFEIYATFSSLITKEEIINATNILFEFMKKNKSKLFITSMPILSGN